MKHLFTAVNATKKLLSNTTSLKQRLKADERILNAEKLFKEIKEDTRRVQQQHKELRTEVMKKAMIANKRVQRLEKAGFDFSRAYREAFQHNSTKFGVRGLRGNKEVLRELERIDKFLASQTSTLTGVKKYLDKLADKKGVKIEKGQYKQFAVQQSNMFRAHEKLAQFRPAHLQYSSDNEMESLNSIIEELNDGYAYSSDEIEAVVELAIEEQEKQVELTRGRRYQGITKAQPVVFKTNKADPIDLDW